MISVLYVDDETGLLELGRDFLEMTGDFKVDLQESAVAALEHLATHTYDAIIADYQMPVMDGLEFLRQVRLHYGQVPFILFTGRGREEVVILALNDGADYYLQKGGEPQSQFAELAHKIRLAVHRRQADLALEESERRYRDVVETQTEFISRFKPDGTHVFVNEAYCRYFKKPRDEIVGHRFIPEIPADDRARIGRHLASLTKDHPTADIEHRIVMADGTIHWHWWSDHAIFDESGRLVEYQSVGKDITDRKRAEEALREREHRLETLGMSIPGAIYQFVLTPDGKYHFLYVCGRWKELFGVAPEDAAVSSESTFAAILPEDVPEVNRTIALSASTRELWHCEFRTRVNGKIRWVLGRSLPEQPRRDGSILWNGVLIDITGRKLAEEELKKSENLYRAIFDNTGAATIIIAPDTTILLANAGWEKLTGVPRADQEKKLSWTVFIDKDDVERMKQYHYARRKDTSLAPTVYECRVIDAKKTVHNCFVHVDMITGTKNSVASLVDITERRKAEDELRAAYEQLTAAEEELQAQFDELKFNQQKIRESEEKYRSIIENLQDAFYRTDLKGNLILVSPSFALELGYDSVDEVLGKNVADDFYFNPADRDLFLKKLAETGELDEYRVLIKKRDGSPMAISVASHIYHDEMNNPAGVEGMIHILKENGEAAEPDKK